MKRRRYFLDDVVAVDHCPICGSARFESLAERADGIWVMKCGDCGMGFTSHRPAEPLALYEHAYYETDSTDSVDMGYRDYDQVASHSLTWAPLLLQLLKSEGKVLDVGCANGHLLDHLDSLFERYGIEANTGFHPVCTKKRIKVIGRDVTDPEVGSQWRGQFDAITAIAVLEHLADMRGGLIQIREMLRSDGVLVFETPLVSDFHNNETWFSSSLEHLVYPTIDGLENLFYDVFSLPLIGREINIPGFGSTFVGVASKDKHEHDDLRHHFNRLLDSPPGELDERERKFRFYFDVIHCANPTNELLASLPDLAQEGLSPATLARLAYLWQTDREFISAAQERLRDHAALIGEIAELRADNASLKHLLDAVFRSTSWRATAPVRWVAEWIGKRSSAFSSVTPREALWLALRFAYRVAPLPPAKKARVVQRLIAKNLLTPPMRLASRPARPVVIRSQRQQVWPSAKPLVSVVIPCFNYGRYITDAVDSVLNQTFEDVEIIVVDGGSDDAQSIEALKGLERPKTTVYWRQGRHLVGDNRNYGIERARGKYICCLDADDLIRPTYLEKALFFLETQAYDVVSSSYELFGESSGVFKVAERPTLRDMLEGNHVATCAVFRKVFWRRAGGFRDVGTGPDYVYEDWRLWIRFAALGARFRNISAEPLFLYRVHSGSLTDNPIVRTAKKHREDILALEAEWITEAAFNESARRQGESVRVENSLTNLVDRVSSDSRPVVLVAFPFLSVGGAERLLSGVLTNLRTEGFRIVIFTHLDTGSTHGDSTEWFRRASDEIYHLPRFLDDTEWEDFINYLLVTRPVQIVWIVGSQLMYDLLKQVKTRSPHVRVIDSLFNTVGHTANNVSNRKWIDLTIVENKEVEEWLRKRGELPERIRVLPSGVDLNDFRPGSKPQGLMERLQLTDDSFVVGFSGRFSEEKQPEMFLGIVKRLSKRTDMEFVMTGAGPLERDIKRRIKRMRIASRLRFEGNVEDVREYLKLYDVLVVPSRLDGRPVVVLEALATGLPVVASRVGGLPDLIRDEETGFLCDPKNPDDFIKRIEWLRREREAHLRMRAAARAFAEQELSAQSMNRRYKDAVQDLLSKPPSSSLL